LREHFFVVNPFLMYIALCDEPGFVLGDVLMLALLDLEDPFEADGVLPHRPVHQRPSLVVLDRRHLLDHPDALLLGVLEHKHKQTWSLVDLPAG
jgi:hypothetical protein